jgi:Tfp pilus assembly protein PilX
MVAIIVLLITTLLATAAAYTAIQTSNSNNRDTNSKRALEAAEAGLRSSTYRMNMLVPDPTHCVTTVIALPNGTTGDCTDGQEQLGNNASFQYWNTPVLPTTTACAGVSGASSQTGVSQRCVTAVGTVNGVSARLQVRLSSFNAVPLFPGNTGVVGLQSVTVVNNASGPNVGTNGTETIDNNANVTGSTLGPGAKLTVGNNGNSGPVTQLTAGQGPLVLAPVNFGNSALSADNTDYRITNGLASPKVTPYDPSTGTSFNAATRMLSISNNGSLTLGGGIYNFCGFSASNNATISLALGVKTVIYIDSPDRPGSGCAAGSGTFSLNNNVSVINPAQNATALQIYVYGLNNGTNVVSFANNSATWATIYAPQSEVDLSNNALLTGAVAGASVVLENNAQMALDSNDQSLTASSVGINYRTAWDQCPSAYASTAPMANCP